MTLLVVLCRRRSRRQQGGAENGLAWVPDPSQKTQNPRNPGVLREADEGIRTLDLRHGKATL
jgi:hypothetical protein